MLLYVKIKYTSIIKYISVHNAYAHILFNILKPILIVLLIISICEPTLSIKVIPYQLF